MDAPIASGDGRVSIYNLSDFLRGTGPTTIQAVSTIADLPAWVTQVGKGYRFAASQQFDGTIAFEYVQREVPPGFEEALAVYYRTEGEAGEWQRLVTLLDARDNVASARMPAADFGSGLYVLVATIELPPLHAGWNLLSYPLAGAAPIEQGLSSLQGSYTVAYEYDDTHPQKWLVHDPVGDLVGAGAAPDAVLDRVRFGRSYLIYATEVVTPYLPVEVSEVMTHVVATIRVPSPLAVPAFVAGDVPADLLDGASVGQQAPLVIGKIDGTLCGEAPVVREGDGATFLLAVTAIADAPGCGEPGKMVDVLLQTGREEQLLDRVPWDTTAVTHLHSRSD